MNIIENFGKTYGFDPIRHFNFQKFSGQRDDIDLYLGDATQRPTNSDQINVFFDFEQPNSMFPGPGWNTYETALVREKTFDKIFTINRDVVSKRNQTLENEKYSYAFFPFNLDYIPEKREPEHDVFFSGHWYGGHYGLHEEVLIPAMNMLQSQNPPVHIQTVSANRGHAPTYAEKLAAYASSRITLAYNHMEVGQKFQHNLQLLQREVADFCVDGTGRWCTYQLKSRVIEGFMSKTLVFSYEDKWKATEDFWIPNQHYIPYKNAEDLVQKINHALENYKKPEYQQIIDNGYEYTKQEYSTDAFFEKFIKDL